MQKSSKPHVVIIMADQLRYDALGEHTPHLNEVQSESIDWSRAYCASPLCVPARGAFFTGKYPNETGALHNAKIEQEKQYGMVGKNHSSLYELAEEEWDSWHTGKMDFRTEKQIEKLPDTKTNWLPLEPRYYHYLEEHGKRRPGGESFKGRVPELAYGRITRTQVVSTPEIGCYEEQLDYFYDGFILKDTLHALKNRNPNKPLMLNAMFFAPHPPIDIPEPWFSLIDDVKLPENVGIWGKNQSPLQLYNITGTMGASVSRARWQEIWKAYLGYVALLDHCVGEVIAELKRQGIYEDTLLIFTSDHGEMLGSHRLWQKMCMYEESIRTPLWMKFPEKHNFKPRVINKLVSSIDIMPTLCDYLKLNKAPEDMSGISLMPFIETETEEYDEKDTQSKQRSIFVQYDGNGSSSNFSRAIVQEDYKLIVDWFKDELYIELYALQEDMQELTNLAFDEEQNERLDSMLEQLRAHMRKTGDQLSLPVNARENFQTVYREFAQ
ncbi:sulfatase family protein [Paenibacillus sp. GXUN7292]|uniref:sulfatase family protein n=1 Tax=Paenibacillus sp. GXUN7292 TaxID=3422499 RepID=UPI003D7DF639